MTRAELLLTQLMEEASEVTQSVSKSLRFGLNSTFTGTANVDIICAELNDLIGVVELLQQENVLPAKIWDADAIITKKAKIEKMLVYSKQCGTLKE